MAKFVVNGKEYASIEAMPPDARAAYQQMQGLFADNNNNGVPDLFEGGGVNVQTMTIDGRSATSRDLSPEEARRVAGQVMGAFGGDPSDAPAFRGAPAPDDDWFRSGPTVPSAPQWDVPRARSRSGIKRLVILLVLVDLLVVGGVLAWLFWVN
ncbi:MAG TPA: hypothetical protein VD886_13295 [Herpetosiphonaceae bacterium]|nr:hypothetical protein [Herpetosiphonaceae bacterium]